MKKYIFLITFIFVCLASFGQTKRILAGYKATSPDSLMPVKYQDTLITIPNSIKGYFNAFGHFVSFSTDSIGVEGSTNLWFTNARARSAISLTTTGSSGASTYNSATGVFNIPQYSGGGGGGGAADSTFFWGLTGNSGIVNPTHFIGSKNNASLNFKANNTRWMQLDSLGSLNHFPGASPSIVQAFYRNSSTATKAGWWSVVGDELEFKTSNAGIDFKTTWNGGSQQTSLRLDYSSPSATRVAVPQAIVTGMIQAKVAIPTGNEYSNGFQVANAAGGKRFNFGIDANEDAVFSVNHVAFGLAEAEELYVPGLFLKQFIVTGNIIIQNKGTPTEQGSARFNVSSKNQGVLIPTLTTTRKNNMVGSVVAGVIQQGISYTNGTYPAVSLTGGTGSGATANVTVSGGLITRVEIVDPGTGYTNSDVLTPTGIGAGSGGNYTVVNTNGVVGALAKGLMIIDTTVSQLNVYNGTNWTGDVTVSSAGTLTLKHGGDYIFTGTTATYTLPAVSTTILGRQNGIKIKNRGSGSITLNSNAGSTIYNTAAQSTITIVAGAAVELLPDGTYFDVLFNL
jgi:hypothetical protein